jgi:hypothetical protein
MTTGELTLDFRARRRRECQRQEVELNPWKLQGPRKKSNVKSARIEDRHCLPTFRLEILA